MVTLIWVSNVCIVLGLLAIPVELGVVIYIYRRKNKMKEENENT